MLIDLSRIFKRPWPPEFFWQNCPCCEACPAPATCDEGACVAFGTVEDCSYCATAPWRYKINFGVSPCFDCCPNASGQHTVCWDSSCTWKSKTFACGGDTYRWQLVIGATSTVSLVRTAGSGTLINVEYQKTSAWGCLCENSMDLQSSSNCDDARDGVCIAPVDLDLTTCSHCPDSIIAKCWEVVIAGVTDDACSECDTFYNGTFSLAKGGYSFPGPFGGTVCLDDGCCFLHSKGGFVCGETAPIFTTTMALRHTSTDGGRWEFAVYLTDTAVGSLDLFLLYALSDVSFDCLGANTLTFVSGEPVRCHYPATVTIQPVECPDTLAAECP